MLEGEQALSKKARIKEVDLYKQQLQMMEQMPEQMRTVLGLTVEEFEVEVQRVRSLIDLSNRGKASRRKGANYENVIAKKFKEVFGITLVRTPMSGGFQKSTKTGDFKGDINCIEKGTQFNLHLECKNHKAWSVGKWWGQTEEDCPPDRIPALVMHRGQVNAEGKRAVKADDFVMLRLDDFLQIVDERKIVERKEETQNGKDLRAKRKVIPRRIRAKSKKATE